MELNIYCDESCHLEHDNIDYMVLGGISCLKAVRKKVSKDIKEIKNKYGISAFNEIKWQSISKNKIDFYLELVDYFFSNENLFFRAIIIDKKQIVLEEDIKFVDFYYKMYFYVLSGLIIPSIKNNIYLDKVDSKSSYRVRKLQQILCNSNYDFNMQNIVNVQNISSFLSLNEVYENFVCALATTVRGAQECIIQICTQIEKTFFAKCFIKICGLF